MRKMKDSGIEWFPSIPAEWNVARLKNVIRLLTDYTANGSFGDLAKNVQYLDEGFARLVRLTDLRENLSNSNGIYIDEPTYHYLGKSKLSSGDILVANVGAYSGLFCEMPNAPFPCSLAPNMFLIRTNNKMLQHYLFYVGSANFVWKQLVQKAISSAQPKLNKTDIRTTFIPIPPIFEQKKIADFLDAKCADIDQIRADIEKQIEILTDYKKSIITEAVTKGLDPKAKMKDSGIEWIGKIPEHWSVNRVKYLVKKPLQYGANESGTDFDESNPRYIRITDITMDNKLKEDGKLSLEKDAAKPYILKDEDILFARSGASVGKTFFYRSFYGESAFAGYLIRASFNNSIIDPKYAYYNTLGNNYEAWKSRAFSQATIQNIGADKYNEYKLPLPPLCEQKSIINYLDEKCSEIDATIAEKQKQLETLEEYKKSLIFEYVTGKKEVV